MATNRLEAFFREDKEPAAIAADIAANPFAWPGGYERWAITDDGGALCRHCCAKERDRIAESSKGDGWHVVAATMTCEVDDCSWCDHCDAHLPGAGCDHAS